MEARVHATNKPARLRLHVISRVMMKQDRRALRLVFSSREGRPFQRQIMRGGIFKGSFDHTGSLACIFSLNATAVRVAEWNQCWYTLLTAARIDQRRPGCSYPPPERGPPLWILFEKRRVVHLSYIDTRRTREGLNPRTMERGGCAELTAIFYGLGKRITLTVPCPGINARGRFYAWRL
jgi:hypothetical protein